MNRIIFLSLFLHWHKFRQDGYAYLSSAETIRMRLRDLWARMNDEERRDAAFDAEDFGPLPDLTPE